MALLILQVTDWQQRSNSSHHPSMTVPVSLLLSLTGTSDRSLQTQFDRFSEKQKLNGCSVDIAYYVSLVRTCRDEKNLAEGKRIHARILSSEFRKERYLSNLLVEMYGKCGSVEDARVVFDEIDEPNSFSWNILAAAYAYNGQLREARWAFDKMPERDVVSWNEMITANAQSGHVEEAKSLFDRMPEPNVVSWNAMVAAYARNGHLVEAKRMFDQMTQKDVISWNAMMQAYAQNGYLEEAKLLFEQIPKPNVVSWTVMIAANANEGCIEEAREVFDRMPRKNLVAWNVMLQAYARNGHLEQARSAFDKMPVRDVISWTSMLTAYSQNGFVREAKLFFDNMPRPNMVSWNAMLEAYAQNGHLHEARNMFEQMPKRNIVSWNILVTAYAQNGYIDEARGLFDKIPSGNAISWTTMIEAYVQHENGTEALALFRKMDQEGLHPEKSTFVSVIAACTSLLAPLEGKIIHGFVVDLEFELDVVVASALISMYGKCGHTQDARILFEKMRERNAVSWNSMIEAYAQNGHSYEALLLFHMMDLEGMEPCRVTFVSILCACSYAGLVDDGRQYFISMRADRNIEPAINHFHCMIDVLGRSGWLEEAEELINTMPFSPGDVPWTTLLGACTLHGDAKRAACAAKHLFGLDASSSAPYALLSNLYGGEKRTTCRSSLVMPTI